MGTLLFGIGAGYAVSKAMSWLTHPAYAARFGAPHVASAVSNLIAGQADSWPDRATAARAIAAHIAEAAIAAGASEAAEGFLVDVAVFRRTRLELAILFSDVPQEWRKLVHIKAPLRVLICDSVEVREFTKMLAAYGDHRAGEQYLVLNWRREKRTIFAHLWRVPGDGRVPAMAVRFQPLPGFPREL